MPPATIGPYEVLAPLGSGGMGEVLLAKTPAASLVALKVVGRDFSQHPTARTRFMGEVDHLKMVFGPGVARFEGADLDADPPWLAVEYVPGVTLHQHVTGHGPIPAELGAILGAVLAEGVANIHLAGVVHRDLKPRNVILGRHGPVIIDFGLAVLTDRDEHVTQSGAAVGTPAFMAPEQARGDRDLTGKADVYALGATLVYALTGHTLYRADSPYALAQRIIDPHDHPDLSGVPADLAGLVGSMLADDPAARPTAGQTMDALVRLVARGRLDAATVRRRLVEGTFVEPDLTLPSDVDDPVVDPEELLPDDAGPTELVSMREPTPPVPTEAAPADVSWLLAEVRAQYGRGGDL